MNKLTESITRSLYYENLNNNFVFSPASYLEAINNLCLCIKGDNLKELLEKLEVSEPDLLSYIKDYKQNLNLETYNTLLYSQEYWTALNQEVINTIKELGADIESLNFNDVLSVVNRVNGIVSEKTHGKINNLISPQDITEFTKFIILNCVYFKKDWLWEFDENRFKNEQPFFGTNKQTQIEFLNKRKYYHFYEDSELDIVELPYKDSDICCYLFIPTKDRNVFDLISNLGENYNKINNVKGDCEVDLTCPQFKTESTFGLVKPTQIAGVNKIFEWNKDWKLVNFNALLPEAVLAVDNIIQKVYIDFTRKGTEAAAATAVFVKLCSGWSGPDLNPPRIKYVRADKPFLYVLANSKNKNQPLFIGIVNNL
ncbi:MAG: serpin family protein [bacterium]|nr:serpin family protein [bacterium]